jgi:hypothetical protein
LLLLQDHKTNTISHINLSFVGYRFLQVGKEGFWYQYIKELDRQRARGVQAVESPLLWSDEELSDLLQVREIL